MRIISADEMKKLDKETISSGTPSIKLMERAGNGLARIIYERFKDKKILIFVGKGNNGGDGFVAARKLSEKGIKVKIILLAAKNEIKGDAKENLKKARSLQIPMVQKNLWLPVIFLQGLMEIQEKLKMLPLRRISQSPSVIQNQDFFFIQDIDIVGILR